MHNLDLIKSCGASQHPSVMTQRFAIYSLSTLFRLGFRSAVTPTLPLLLLAILSGARSDTSFTLKDTAILELETRGPGILILATFHCVRRDRWPHHGPGAIPQLFARLDRWNSVFPFTSVL